MNDITIFPADIAELSVSQLAALPPAQKHEIDQNLDAAIDWLKKARAKFDAALDQCYGEQARAALRDTGRDFGTAHISDGPLHLKFDLPKKTTWNQDRAREIAAHLVAAGDTVVVDGFQRIKPGDTVAPQPVQLPGGGTRAPAAPAMAPGAAAVPAPSASNPAR